MYLALDLGSTHFKAAVFDPDLTLCGQGRYGLSHAYPEPGGVELDVDHAREGVRTIIAAALADAGTDAGALQALAITSQAQTCTVFDVQGQARRAFISWQDARAQDLIPALKQSEGLTGFAQHSSFSTPIPGMQISLLWYLRGAEPMLVTATDTVLKLPTWLVCELSGQAWIDSNLAAMSGLYSLVEQDWWLPALRACALTRGQLPRICSIGATPCGTSEAAGAFGLPAGIPIVLAGNDQTAGAYGVEVHRGGGALITLGTAQVAYTVHDELLAPRDELVRGEYPGHRFYGMVVDNNGGNTVTWASENIPDCESVEHFFTLAEQAPVGAHGVAFAPDGGSGSGVFLYQTPVHTPADLARAVLEAAVKRLTHLIRELRVDCSAVPVAVAGGGSRSALWTQLLGERLGATLKRVEADPLLGAARMARDATGSGGLAS